MNRSQHLSRRDFIAASSAATATLLLPNLAFAQGSDTIKVGLIGCGGRGSGAIADAVAASQGVVLWSVGDVFQDRIDGAKTNYPGQLKDRYQVTDNRAFVGFDAYKGVINSGVDMVILATPPGFRPEHLKTAIDAGKHVFMEKPVAVDAPGVRSVIESSEMAKTKGLAIVAGTQRRHDPAYQQTMQRIHEGAIGDVESMACYWNQGGLWMNPRQPAWTDMEWQLRNWLYFTWLSGDHICEQHIHNIDVCNWAIGKHPVKALGLGGRQVRTDPAYGHVYDHFSVEFEYDNGVKMQSMCRQIDGTASRVSEHIVGSKGTSNANGTIKGATPWRYEGERPNPYVEEHRNLVASIRAGKPLNEGVQVAESTLTAIMGRTACYTGQEITWDKMMASTEDLMPETLAFGPLPVAPVAMPGKTPFK